MSKDEIDMYHLKKGDLLFVRVNGSSDLVGRCIEVNIDYENLVFNDHLIRVRLKENILPEFVRLISEISDIRAHLIEQASTSAGQLTVNQEAIATIPIPLPPLAEQRRIAALLSDHIAATERARAAATARLAAARALRAALLREVFESEEAQGWERKTLNDLCRDITDGTHFTPTYISKGVPFLSVKDVRETGISFEECRFISEEQHKDLCRRCKPERGDVLYTKVGTTGIAKAIEIDREFSIFVSVALLKLRSEVIPQYLEKVLNSPLGKSQAEELTQGMANRNLVIKDIKRIEVPIPTISEQRRIVGIVSEQLATIESAIAAAEAQRDTIATLPAALLRRAFSGEL